MGDAYEVETGEGIVVKRYQYQTKLQPKVN
jgi:hypothetical protein